MKGDSINDISYSAALDLIAFYGSSSVSSSSDSCIGFLDVGSLANALAVGDGEVGVAGEAEAAADSPFCSSYSNLFYFYSLNMTSIFLKENCLIDPV